MFFSFCYSVMCEFAPNGGDLGFPTLSHTPPEFEPEVSMRWLGG